MGLLKDVPDHGRSVESAAEHGDHVGEKYQPKSAMSENLPHKGFNLNLHHAAIDAKDQRCVSSIVLAYTVVRK
jgi:hypothetical protein